MKEERFEGNAKILTKYSKAIINIVQAKFSVPSYLLYHFFPFLPPSHNGFLLTQ
jgi:hypothetical protein